MTNSQIYVSKRLHVAYTMRKQMEKLRINYKIECKSNRTSLQEMNNPVDEIDENIVVKNRKMIAKTINLITKL